MLVWAKVMAEMIMASCMGPESITLMMLVNSITTIIIRVRKSENFPDCKIFVA